MHWKRTAVLLTVGVAAVCLLSPAAAWARGASSNPSYSFPAAVRGLTNFVLHLDKHLSAIIAEHGAATYAILFAIVFAETGFVLTPFLPGDSLLFAAGAFAALGSLNVWALFAVFITAAILGDALNYAIGNYAGARAIERGVVNKEFIKKTEDFYRKHGGKTVILARFVPIVRTFAPFVAGVGSMPYAEFGAYNVAGALLWTIMFVGAGFFLGNLPAVKHNFTLVVLGIVAVSVLPIVFEIIMTRRESGSKGMDKQGLPKGPARWRPG
ncbi:g4620 [Coccomyxa viridis]|uniref:G4620 protein n=1 Tax=Coccomyxa viridis TaxID=1274662 RepID=A0ABP1FS86_9CHLO